MPDPIEGVRLMVSSPEAYQVRLARDASDLRLAQQLRFAVFNLELNEGLVESVATGRDADAFDAVCDHLLVECRPTREIVGTYRLQTGRQAAAHLGYYSAQEFDLTGFEAARAEIIELGRACVAKAHRNLTVLGLLWKGIGAYAQERGGRYLFGCSSLTSQDSAVGAAAYAELRERHLAPPEWRVQPWPAVACLLEREAETRPRIPKLLRAYLGIGAKICGPPALDRDFKTIDFLTWLDLRGLTPEVQLRFLGGP